MTNSLRIQEIGTRIQNETKPLAKLFYILNIVKNKETLILECKEDDEFMLRIPSSKELNDDWVEIWLDEGFLGNKESFEELLSILEHLNFIDEIEQITKDGENFYREMKTYYESNDENSDCGTLKNLNKYVLLMFNSLKPELKNELLGFSKKGYLDSQERIWVDLEIFNLRSPSINSNCFSVDFILQKYRLSKKYELTDPESLISEEALFVEGVTDMSILISAYMAIYSKTPSFEIIPVGTCSKMKEILQQNIDNNQDHNLIGLLDYDKGGVDVYDGRGSYSNEPKKNFANWQENKGGNSLKKIKSEKNCDILLLPCPESLDEKSYIEKAGEEILAIEHLVNEITFLQYNKRAEKGDPKRKGTQIAVKNTNTKGRWKISENSKSKREFAMYLRNEVVKGNLGQKDFESFQPLFNYIDEKFGLSN